MSEFVRASEGPSPETLRPYFHDTVAPYYRMASADWASIEKEKATYFSRFSTIRYTVVGSPSITATDNGEKVEVDLAYRATQTNGDTLTGTTRWTMTVRYFDGAWKIAGIQERRVAP